MGRASVAACHCTKQALQPPAASGYNFSSLVFVFGESDGVDSDRVVMMTVPAVYILTCHPRAISVFQRETHSHIHPRWPSWPSHFMHTAHNQAACIGQREHRPRRSRTTVLECALHTPPPAAQTDQASQSSSVVSFRGFILGRENIFFVKAQALDLHQHIHVRTGTNSGNGSAALGTAETDFHQGFRCELLREVVRARDTS